MKNKVLMALIIAGVIGGASAAEFNNLTVTAASLAKGNAAVPVPAIERLDVQGKKTPDQKTAVTVAEFGKRIRLEKDIFLKRTDAMSLQFQEKAKGKYNDICSIQAYMVVVDTTVPATVIMQGTLLNITRVSDRETYSDTEGDGTEYQISAVTVQISEDPVSNLVAACRAKKGTRKIPSLSEVEKIFQDYFIVWR